MESRLSLHYFQCRSFVILICAVIVCNSIVAAETATSESHISKSSEEELVEAAHAEAQQNRHRSLVYPEDSPSKKSRSFGLGYGSFTEFLRNVGKNFRGISSRVWNYGRPYFVPRPRNGMPDLFVQRGDLCGLQAPWYQPAIQPNHKHRIINGQDAQPHSWPWQVIVHSGGGMCGGTLVEPDVVITAAHCLNSRTKTARITAGAHHLMGMSEDEVILNARGIAHPAYDAKTEENDIALLKLERPFNISDKIRPVCLVPAGMEIPPGTKCVITGWGRTRANTEFMDIFSGGTSSMPTTLQEAQVPVMSDEDCRKIMGDNLKSTMICAGGAYVDACQGDSGGPFVCKHGDRWALHGATSWGFSCGKPGLPGIYTKISAYVPWIHEMMYGSK